MRQDAKLGLALGMLVVGFAIAFCFPRPQDFPNWETAYREEPQEQLDFVPLRSYQPTASDDSTSPEIVVDGGRSLTDADHPSPVQPLTQRLVLHEDQLKSTASASLNNLLAPRDTTPVVSEQKSIANPSHTDAPVEELPVVQPSLQSPVESQRYRVQPGDTLTGIAYRTLGSSTRYFELYEYNKDQLTSPDDVLRIGLELRIPPGAQWTATPVEPQSTLAETDEISPIQANTTHVIKRGDTLEGISRKYYQDPFGVEAIREANPDVDPGRLRLGLELNIPVRR